MNLFKQIKYLRKPKRIWLNEVELGINYAIILNTNAGLWGYNIGDTIKFVSLNPFKIVVTGRIKHFISAFGEHVIVEEVESAITALCAKSGVEVIDFTVAPQIEVENGLPYHELINGNILEPLKISPIKTNGFRDYMESIGKLGGQNKIPRLGNDRKMAEKLSTFLL